MLAKSLVEQIDRLLREGNLSHRKIAAQFHVSRSTVAAIASGRRGLFGKERDDDMPCSLTPLSPPERCPRCGYRVYMPCLICRHRDDCQRRTQLRVAAIAATKLAARNVGQAKLGAGGQKRRRARGQSFPVAWSPGRSVFDALPAGDFRAAPRPALPAIPFIPSPAMLPAKERLENNFFHQVLSLRERVG